MDSTTIPACAGTTNVWQSSCVPFAVRRPDPGRTGGECRRRAERRRADRGGDAGSVRLARIRKAFEAVDGRLYLSPWWRGAAADRLLDERHAELVERLVALLRERGWIVGVEVSFNEWGERGSIDVLAWHPVRRAVAVCEAKTAFGSIEETDRILDVKVRVASGASSGAVGWRPVVVGLILVVPEAADQADDRASRGDDGKQFPARVLRFAPGCGSLRSTSARSTSCQMDGTRPRSRLKMLQPARVAPFGADKRSERREIALPGVEMATRTGTFGDSPSWRETAAQAGGESYGRTWAPA